MATKLKYILGSGSSSRKLILSQMNWKFDVIKPNLDEKAIGDRSSADGAQELVLLLGTSKADDIMSNLTPEQKDAYDVLITCDQVVTHRNKILEKPVDANEAREFIRSYGQYSCATVGSIVLTNIKTGQRVSGVDTATIYLKPIPESIIDELIEEGEIFYCAGGLMIEHPKVEPYINRIDGTMNSIMGLSSELLNALLLQLIS